MTSNPVFFCVHAGVQGPQCDAAWLFAAAALLVGTWGVPRAAAQDTAPSDLPAPMELAFADSSFIVIEGTSNRSDWTVHAPEFTAQVRVDEDARPADVTLIVNALAMESRKSTIMDRLMRGSLNTDEHDTITFASSGISRQDSTHYVVAGELELAGTKQPVSVPVTRSMNATGQAVWVGETTLLMTDYGIKPPTAMFGALHTGAEVTVRFRLVEE